MQVVRADVVSVTKVIQIDVSAAAPVVPVVAGPAVLPETCELVFWPTN